MSNLDTLETILNNDIAAKWINLRDYALDKLEEKPAIKSIMDTSDKYGYGEWGAVGQVPIMTSNTAPSGLCFGSGVSGSNYDYYYAFDATANNKIWDDNGNRDFYYIGYKFTEPKVIKQCRFNIYLYDHQYIVSSNYKVQGSNDTTNGSDGTWTDLSTAITCPAGKSGPFTINLNSNNAYMAYRLHISGKNWNNAETSIGTLQFLAYEPLGNVPIMTANNAPYGVASASSVYSSTFDAYKAFNGNDSDGWTAAQASLTAVGNWVAYEFVNPINVKKVHVLMNADQSSVITCKFKIQAYDGSQWKDLCDEILAKLSHDIDCDDEGYYTKFRLYFTTAQGNTGGYFYIVQSLQFYGREEPDYSEKEFAPGSTIKYIYDHGVKPSGAITASSIGTSSNSMTEESNQLLFSISGSSAQAVVLSPSVDMSDYDNVWVKVGSKATSSSANFGHLRLLANTSNFTGQKGQLTFPNPLTVLNPSLDVTQINEGVYIAPCTDNAGSSVTHTIAFTEIYVE